MKRQIEQSEELFQRRLIHAVDETHFSDEEVHDAATRCHCSVLLTGRVDLHLGVGGNLQLLTHFKCRRLRVEIR